MIKYEFIKENLSDIEMTEVEVGLGSLIKLETLSSCLGKLCTKV